MTTQTQDVNNKAEKLVDRIKRSSEDVGELYPVLVDENDNPLDGRTRLKANPNWRKEVIPNLTEEQKFKIKYHSNWHRKDFDRSAALEEIAKETGWRGLKPYADFLDVCEKTISSYLPQKYKDNVKSGNRKGSVVDITTKKIEKEIQNIGETVKAVQKSPCAEEKKAETVQNLKTSQILLEQLLLDTIITKTEQQSPTAFMDEWLDEINWEFSLWDCEDKRPEGFGDETFQGNCSPTIIYALLKRYSTVNDELIFDPMAGSGTFIDVAKAMGYNEKQILARDIKPLRDDIKDGDASDTKLPDNSVDFIFSHYPYWRLIQYSDDPRDLSKIDYNAFLEKMEKIFVEMHRILRKDRIYVVMIGNLRSNGILDLEAQLSLIGSRYFTLWDKIIRKIRTWNPETRGQRMGLAVARAKQHNYSVVDYDTLLVFRKDKM